MAVVVGSRAAICAMAVPSRIRDVCAANQVSGGERVAAPRFRGQTES